MDTDAGLRAAKPALQPVTSSTLLDGQAARSMRALSTFALSTALSLSIAHGAEASQTNSDPELLNALRSDEGLKHADCILAAVWLNESYPRITVDAVCWKKLRRSAQTNFSVRALKVAEATYLTEFAATDQYQEIVIVDQHRKLLTTYQP